MYLPINLAPDPSFEKGDLAFWVTYDEGATLELSTDAAAAGDTSLLATVGVAGTMTVDTAREARQSANEDEPYVAQARFLPKGATRVAVGITSTDDLESKIGTTYEWVDVDPAATDWVTVTIHLAAAPGGTSFISPSFAVEGPEGARCHIDAVMLVPGTTAPRYFDGDTSKCTWAGAPHASVSRVIDANLQADASFEGGTSFDFARYFLYFDDFNLSYTTADAFHGETSLLIPAGEAAEGNWGYALASHSHAISYQAKAATPGGSCTVTFTFEYRDGRNSNPESFIQTFEVGDTWTTISLTGMASSAARSAWVDIDNAAGGSDLLLDACTYTLGDTPLLPYADGDTSGWTWTGTPVLSSSHRSLGGQVTSDLLWAMRGEGSGTGVEWAGGSAGGAATFAGSAAGRGRFWDSWEPVTTEPYAPNVVTFYSGYSSASVYDINEDPDSGDSAWLTAVEPIASEVVVGFPTPPAPLANTQEMRVLARISGGSASETATVAVLDNGVAVAEQSFTVTSATGQVVSLTCPASAISNPMNVECRVLGTATTSGSPNSRGMLEVGAIEWMVSYQAPPIHASGAAVPGEWTFTSSAAGVGVHPDTGQGASGQATGDFNYTGTASGEKFVIERAAGSATGAFSFVGAADGSTTRGGDVAAAEAVYATVDAVGVHGGRGQVSGAVTWVGAGGGSKSAAAIATGSWEVSGAGAGARTTTGTAAGGVAFSESAEGTKTAAQAVTAGLTYDVEPDGARRAVGAAGGTLTYSGAAEGAPSLPGSAKPGNMRFAGATSGTKGTRGSSDGTLAYTGNAAGDERATATATGAFAYTGAATGTKSTSGTSADTWTATGAGTGEKHTGHAATGSWRLQGATEGHRQARGEAAGVITWAGAGAGAPRVGSEVTGGFAFVGSTVGGKSTTGAATPAGTSYTGDVAGQKVTDGAAAGEWTSDATSDGEKVADGTASGTVHHDGTAKGEQVRGSDARGRLAYSASGVTGTKQTTGAGNTGLDYAAASDGDKHTHGAASGRLAITVTPAGGKRILGAAYGDYSLAAATSGRSIRRGDTAAATSWGGAADGDLTSSSGHAHGRVAFGGTTGGQKATTGGAASDATWGLQKPTGLKAAAGDTEGFVLWDPITHYPVPPGRKGATISTLRREAVILPRPVNDATAAGRKREATAMMRPHASAVITPKRSGASL